MVAMCHPCHTMTDSICYYFVSFSYVHVQGVSGSWHGNVRVHMCVRVLCAHVCLHAHVCALYGCARVHMCTCACTCVHALV